MRQLWLLVSLAGTGCNQLLGIDELTHVDGGGQTIDSSGPRLDSPEGMTCAMLVTPASCFSNPTAAVSIMGTINTDTDSRCVPVPQTTGPALCAMVGGTITISAAGATITGARPLLLLATMTITVNGVLDASSTNKGTARTGPGSTTNPTDCMLPTPDPSTEGKGGGAGGSFRTKGGDGGKGAGGGGGHPGATATSALSTTVIRAGCRGSDGGGAAGDHGPGGPGGGAIYLVAGSEILIANQVRANGAAGIGATRGEGGGGGGGSGGMIILEAPTITLTGASAQLYANGAGGGEGAVGSKAGDGNESMVWNVAATGGSAITTLGGDGGTGAVLATEGLDASDGASGGPNDGGGGGGGGGGGLVWIKGTLAGLQLGQISPPATRK